MQNYPRSRCWNMNFDQNAFTLEVFIRLIPNSSRILGTSKDPSSLVHPVCIHPSLFVHLHSHHSALTLFLLSVPPYSVGSIYQVDTYCLYFSQVRSFLSFYHETSEWVLVVSKTFSFISLSRGAGIYYTYLGIPLSLSSTRTV